VAILIATGLGLFLGAIIAYRAISPHLEEFTNYQGTDWGDVVSEYCGTILFWPIAGGIVGAGIVYVRQLLRY
jgi:hypothetical protein